MKNESLKTTIRDRKCTKCSPINAAAAKAFTSSKINTDIKWPLRPFEFNDTDSVLVELKPFWRPIQNRYEEPEELCSYVKIKFV